MTYRRWSKDEVTYVMDQHNQGFAHEDIATNLNQLFHDGEPVRNKQKVTDTVHRNKNGEFDFDAPEDKRERRIWGDDGSTVAVSNRAYSDEEMAEMFDVNMELWRITKRITNVWGNQTQTKLFWEPKELEHLAANWEALLEEVRAEAKEKTWVGPPTAVNNQGLLYQINIFDAHIGMKGWGPETGEDYDLNIAIDRYRDAFHALLQEAPAGARILYVVGQDLFHFDTLIQGKGGATAKGTPQDVDSRWQKLFVATCDMVSDCIVEAREAQHQVDVVVVPGNHDTQTTFYLGQYLKARFHSDYSGHNGVRVDNSPRTRKYYAFGDVLLGFTHGNEEKVKDLFGLMAEEAVDEWSESFWREWHRGHVHQEECSEDGRMRIRTMPALSGTDAWHAQKGYRSLPGARAFLWHRTRGIVRQEYFNVISKQNDRVIDYLGPVLTVS
jgi:hypothetical protein